MQNRRFFLKRSVIALNILWFGAIEPASSLAAEAQIDKTQDDKAREARDVASALAILEVQSPGPGNRILLEAPEIADKNESFSIKVKSAIPKTDWIAVLIDKNKFPFVGQFSVAGAKTAEIEVKIKLNLTSTVIVVARADGKYYRVDKEVKVAVVG